MISLQVALRTIWRLPHVLTSLLAAVAACQHRPARLGLAALYLCMLVLPLFWHLLSNFGKHGIKFFDAVHLAPWGPDDRTLYTFFNQAQHLVALLLALLIGLHVFVVDKHKLIDRDGLLRRRSLRFLTMETR